MLDQAILQLNIFPFDSDPGSFQEQSASMLETPDMIVLSTIPTPNFEICPATPLNETPGNQNILPLPVDISPINNIHLEQLQSHLQPRQTHRARSSSISSLSSVTSSVSSFEDTLEIESENTLINMNMDMAEVGINMSRFNLNSPHSTLSSPNILADSYIPNEDLLSSQNHYLAANTQLGRSSSLSSNNSGTNCIGCTADAFISEDEGFQELLASHLFTCRRSSVCNTETPTSSVDPDFFTQDELMKLQAGHGRSYSLSTLDFQSFDSNLLCQSYERTEFLVPETQHLKPGLSQETTSSGYDGSLQLSQEELQFIAFNSDLQPLNDLSLCKQTGGNNGTQFNTSNRSPTEYPCTISGCSKTFRRKHSLLSHQRTHSDDKPYPCEYCGRPFARKHDMLRHRRMHTGQKPYLCEACGAGFYRTDARQRHYQAESKCWAVVMKNHTDV